MKAYGLFACVALLLAARGLAAQPVSTQHVEAELVPEVASIQPGRPFRVALRLRMEDEWHTYWRNPGDAGMPTSIEWTLPEGFTAGDIQWPWPEMTGEAPEVSYSYGGEILLPVTITPPAGLDAGTDVVLGASASWLVCREVCIPGSAELSLTLPVRPEAPQDDSHWRAAFDAIDARLPRPLDGWRAAAHRTADGFRLRLMPEGGPLPPASGIIFFAGDEGVIDHSAPQNVESAGDAITIDLRSSPYASSPAGRLRGLLYAPGGWNAGGTIRAMEVDVEVQR